MAVGCLSLQQGLSLLTQMKVSFKQIYFYLVPSYLCVCICAQEAGLIPDQHVMGTLFGNAASKRNYEYLVALMKVHIIHVRFQI